MSWIQNVTRLLRSVRWVFVKTNPSAGLFRRQKIETSGFRSRGFSLCYGELIWTKCLYLLSFSAFRPDFFCWFELFETFTPNGDTVFAAASYKARRLIGGFRLCL